MIPDRPRVPSTRPAPRPRTPEHARLAESPDPGSPWRSWGAYVSGRQWGTVREDYSAGGDAWTSFPFEQAGARAYRWGEDGLAGLCDRFGFLTLGLALWNGRDPVLKERLFGLTNGEGNHGEDVKEYWWALDATPTHSWLRWLYRYPQAAFPYEQLRRENAARDRDDREFELADTGVLDDHRWFDVELTCAKAAPEDLCLEYRVTNAGPDPAPLHLLPQVWFHNTWSWGDVEHARPSLRALPESETGPDLVAVRCDHELLGTYHLAVDAPGVVLVCDNETDTVGLWGATDGPAHPKNAVERRVVHGATDACAPDGASGTKAAVWLDLGTVAPGATVVVRARLSPAPPDATTFDEGFDAVLADRRAEADAFYAEVIPSSLTADDTGVARRAFAGLVWGQQLYRYDVARWLDGDPTPPPPPAGRRGDGARNVAWRHLALADVMTMPDEWEYPWFASWDLALQCVPLAHIDPAFAKNQLLLLCREWAMHPSGQLPAYEWSFSDSNPPLHAWAAWQVYVADGRRDRQFLARVFTKLLLNSTWWINRKDADGSDLFEGGFLGMDNIGLFDRSAPLPDGARLEEADATGWMAFHFLAMNTIAIELGRGGEARAAWDDLAVTYTERFLAIATKFRPGVAGLWDDADGFAYDVLVERDGATSRLPVRSMVGLLPLLGVLHTTEWGTADLPALDARMRWWEHHRPELLAGALSREGAAPGDVLFSALSPAQVVRVVTRMFDPAAFLSPHGIRSLSAEYRTPFTTSVRGQTMTIDYEPGESRTGLFGGNSNWRGPVWFPVNVLLADALRTYGGFFGASLTVPGLPHGSTFTDAAAEIEDRLIALFRPGPGGGPRPADGARLEASPDPAWREQVTFYEYFDGDTGEGLGATHQTGWTALVAHLLCQRRDGSGPGGRQGPPATL